jgi:Zn-dependent protease
MFGSRANSQINSILNWNVRIGRMFGIPIHLHITLLFFILPAFSGRRISFWHGLEWAFLIVISILLHELGHALTAKRYGMRDLTIMLHGFGGFASSTGPRTPQQALRITLAGPAVTLALGVICWGLGRWALNVTDFDSELGYQAWTLFALGLVNLQLAVLNMLPCLPWDGGNALRAVLAHRISEFKATRHVAHIGLVVAFFVGGYGLITGTGYLGLFGLVGFITSLGTLLQTGGIRFQEAFEDRKHRKEVEAVKQREKDRQGAYLDEVAARERERKEQERLRKLLGE